MDKRQEILKNKEMKNTKKEFKENMAVRVVKDIIKIMKTKVICQIKEIMTGFSTHLNTEKMTKEMITMNSVPSNVHLKKEILMLIIITGRKWVAADPEATPV